MVRRDNIYFADASIVIERDLSVKSAQGQGAYDNYVVASPWTVP